MARRWFKLINGLLMATLCVTEALGQTASQPNALADRMAALRRGWSQGESRPQGSQAADQAQQNQGAQPTQNQKAATPANTQKSANTQSHSLLPGWFHRSANKKTANQPQNRNASNSRGMANTANQSNDVSQIPEPVAVQDSASRTQSSAATPRVASRDSAALPGLGGSPLPRAGSVSNTVNPMATPNSSAATSQADTSATKKLNVSSPTATSSSSPRTTRQSPGRRTAPHIDPNDLRRELAGAFPGTTANDATATTTPIEPSVTATDEMPAKDNAAAAETNTSAPTSITPTAPLAVEQAPQLTTPATTSAPQSAAESFGATPDSHSTFGNSTFVRQPRSNMLTPSQQSARGKEAFGEALQVAGGGDPSVLVSNQNTVMVADIRGPKQILVGREAVYRIRLKNESDFAAEGVVATVSVPPSAEVVSTNASEGMVRQPQEAKSAGQLQWQLARMEKLSGETLEIRLIPRDSKPLELGITWTVAPVGSRAVVEVQEPKLQLEVNGPNEVLYGKPQVFKLTLTNPGTGPAEKVKIDLMPPGGGQDAVTSHPLGDLAPGASQTIEVELTAREAGKMMVKAVASAEGGLNCDAAKEVFCRKAELEVDSRGPATKYAGTLATYFFRIRNPGTAPAEDVTVKVTMPEGAEFISCSDGQTFDAKQKLVTWHAGTLNAGDDKYMELKCQLTAPGNNQFRVTAATATGDLHDEAIGETTVIALADLKLDVSDPSGPVAVGSQAVYEIHVQNRGSSSAKDVNILALFSEGIEPDQAEGAQYTVADGRVSFRAIEELPAGRDVVLRIRAHAVQAGTHVFRAEVLCRDLEIKLAAEETTRFYADDVADGQQSDSQSANREGAPSSAVR